MKNIIFIFISVVLFSSCIEDVELKGFDGVKLEKTETKNLALKLGIKISNPNFFSIKIKPSKVDVFIDNQLIGKAILDDNVKLIKKKEDTYFVKLGVDLENGALFSFLRFALKSKLELRCKGMVKYSVYGLPKNVKIDYVKEIDGAMLRIENLLKF